MSRSEFGIGARMLVFVLAAWELDESKHSHNRINQAEPWAYTEVS